MTKECDVLFVYPNILDIPIHPEFDRYEELMLNFAKERNLIGLARGTVVPPTSMLSLSAFLKEGGLNTSFLDLTIECFNGGDTEKILRSELKRMNPKIVAINGMEDCFLSALYKITKIVKEHNETVYTITGGVSATTRDEEVLKASAVDFIVRNEGEVPLLELSKTLLQGADVKEVRGISFMEGGKGVVRTGAPAPLDLTTLPFPNREDYPLKKLYSINGGVDLVYASRGCSGSCSFCNAPTFWGRKWRGREPADVVEELAYVKEQGAKIVHIYDLNFGTNKKWVMEVCEGIKREGVDVIWDCELSLVNFNKSFLKMIHRGGCRGAFCGIEATNQDVLDSVNKPYSSKNLISYLLNAKEVGIHVDGGYVFGLPEDTLQGMQTTSKLACKLLEEDLVETPAPFLFVPFRGTEIGDNLEAYGIRIADNNTDDWHFFSPKPLVSTKYASPEEVHREWVNCIKNVNNILESKLGK